MSRLNFLDGRYTLGHMMRTVASQTPALVFDWRRTLANLHGAEKLPGKIGISLYLRMARLMGCPVCEAYFPRFARSRGFTKDQIAEALGDIVEKGHLSPEQRAAIDYGEQVLRCDGGRANPLPEELDHLRESQVRAFVRMSMLIHAVGLSCLPHKMIRHSRGHR